MKPMNAFRRFVGAGRRLGLLVLAGVFLPGLRAQISDGPLGVPVKIWGAAAAKNNQAAEPGSLDLSCSDFLESYPGANDGEFLVSGGAVAPHDFLTNRKVARLEVGKSYQLNVEGLFLANLGVNAVPPPGYDMEINGVVRTRFQLSPVLAQYLTPMTIRVLPKGGGFTGRAGEATSLAGDRIRWEVALGGLTSGGTARALALIDPGTSSDWSTIFTPASWSYESPSSEVFVYRENYAPRQIFAPQAAVDVVTVAGTSFVVKFYHPNQVSGTTYPKTFTGDPYVTYQIEKGDTATSLKITSQTRNITSFTATNVVVARTAVTTLTRTGSWPGFGWTLKDWNKDANDGTQLVQEARTGGGTIADRASSRSVLVPGQTAVTQIAEAFHLSAWGESTMSIIRGASNPHDDPVTTTFDYYATESAPGSYAQVKSATMGSATAAGVVTPGSQWEAYEYYDAASNDRHTGVLKYRYRPFNGTPATVTLDPAQGESTYFEYMADAFGMSTRASRIETKTNGNTTALTTISYSDPVTINGMLVVAATRTDFTSATDSLVTITKYYREDVADAFFRSQIHTIDQPNGVRHAMAYQRGTWSNGVFTLSANSGTAAGTASRIVTITGQKPATDGTTSFEGYIMDNVQLVTGKSTKEVTFRDERALVVRTETYAWMGSWILVKAVAFGYDNAGQLIGRAENAATPLNDGGAYTGATYTATYDGEQKTSETDPTGVVVGYTYDSAGRVATATRGAGGSIVAAVTTFEYDAENRVVKQTVGAAPGETLVSRWSYDSAGRIQTEMPAGLGQTSYTYDYDSSTQKWTRTKTAPKHDTTGAGGTTIWTYHPGGQLEKIEGSAVVSRYFAYDVLSDGRRTVQVNEGSASSPRWRKSWIDWLGRAQHTERAGVTGQAALAEDYSYDGGGRLAQLGRTGYAPRFYEYDELSQLKRTGLGISHPAGPLAEQSDDRITDYDQRFESWNGAYWLRHETTIRPVSGSAAGFTSFSRQRLTGFAGTLQDETRTQDLEGNTATTTTDVDRSAKTVTVATSRSGVGGSETQLLTNGFMTGTVDHAGLGTVFIYDALGRLSTVTDSRNNTTTAHYFTNSPLAYYVEDATPAHNAVYTFAYYDNGAIRSQRDVKGNFVYFSYNPRGQLVRQWGGATHPVEYGYDATYGDRVTLKTFRGGSGWNDETGPTDPGPADWTRWVYDESTGLLKEKYDSVNLDPSTGAVITIPTPKKVAYTYNSRGQVETRKLARGPKTSYGYDSNTGELLTQTYQDEETGIVTHPVNYTYTRTGQPNTVVDLTGKREFVYDSAKPWRRSAEKYSTDIQYFGTGRVMSTLYQETVNDEVVGRYRGFRVGAAVDSNSDLEQTLGFTAAGRIDTVAGKRSGNAVSRTFKYDYLANAALVSALSVVGESGFGVSYDYEAKRDLLTKVDATWNSTSRARYDYVYNALGQRYTAKQSGTAFGDFTAATYYRYDYNERGELTSAADYLGDTPTTLTGTPDGNAQLPSRNFAYAYDNQGNRLSSSRNGIAGLDTYQPNSLNQYDSRTNNLARAAGTVASGTAVITATAGGLTWTSKNTGGFWAADGIVPTDTSPSLADLTVQAATPNGGGAGVTSVRMDATHKVAISANPQAFGYDADGNLTSDGVWSYVYDAENRLIRMTSTLGTGFTHLKLEFAYDYLGRRVEKKVTNNDTQAPVSQRRYLYDGWNLIAELTGDGSGITRSYTWGLDLGGALTSSSGPGGLVQITDHASGNRYFPAYDGNGNVAALLNAGSGAVAISYEYSPFGELLRAGAATATSGVDSVIADNPFRFATKFADVETGLVYYGHRFYSPTLGRFINRDPIEEAGGANLYGFCGNDSVNGSDFLGMDDDRPVPLPEPTRVDFPPLSGPQNQTPDFNRKPFPEPRENDIGVTTDRQIRGSRRSSNPDDWFAPASPENEEHSEVDELYWQQRRQKAAERGHEWLMHMFDYERRSAEMYDEITSFVFNNLPVVGAFKSAAEFWTGTDLLTGARVPRWISALGVVAGFAPFGEEALRSAPEILLKIARAIDDVAHIGGDRRDCVACVAEALVKYFKITGQERKIATLRQWLMASDRNYIRSWQEAAGKIEEVTGLIAMSQEPQSWGRVTEEGVYAVFYTNAKGEGHVIFAEVKAWGSKLLYDPQWDIHMTDVGHLLDNATAIRFIEWP